VQTTVLRDLIQRFVRQVAGCLGMNRRAGQCYNRSRTRSA